MKTENETKNRPVHKIEVETIVAAIWANKAKYTAGMLYSVRITRRYPVAGTWRETPSFGVDELPLVAKAAELAREWILNAQALEN
ncbi:MAG: hypothetical protein WD851_15580 [Pirellulales bacterium]